MNRRDQKQLGAELGIDMRGIGWFETPGYKAWRVRLRMLDPKHPNQRSKLIQTCFPVKSKGGVDEALAAASKYQKSQIKIRNQIKSRLRAKKKELDAKKRAVLQSEAKTRKTKEKEKPNEEQQDKG